MKLAGKLTKPREWLSRSQQNRLPEGAAWKLALMEEELPVLDKWMDFLAWFTEVTEKFPKKVRWSLSSRLESHGYDVLELLITAKYAPRGRQKQDPLRKVNLKLDLMRFLLRHSHRREFLSTRAYEKCSRDIAEVGRMVGGWQSQQGRP